MRNHINFGSRQVVERVLVCQSITILVFVMGLKDL